MKAVINVNDIVYVELNKNGWNVIRKHYLDLYNGCEEADKNALEAIDMYKRRTHKYLHDGWHELTQFQVHELMNIFGRSCFVGARPSFINNNIYLTIDESTKVPNEYDIEKSKMGS